MRLMTYNIHGCIGTDGCKDPARVIEVIESVNADVVALQEVHNETVKDRTFLQMLESLAGMHVIFGPTLKRNDADYGNLLLSRFQPKEINKLEIHYPKREPRGAISATLSCGVSQLRVIATHLGLSPKERRHQLNLLALEAQKHARGTQEGDFRVLMGDLNHFGNRGLEHYQSKPLYDYGRRVRTYPSRFPLLPLDRIWFAPTQYPIKRFAWVTGKARKASDHLPLVADVEMP